MSQDYEGAWFMKLQMRRDVMHKVIFPFRWGPEYEISKDL